MVCLVVFFITNGNTHQLQTKQNETAFLQLRNVEKVSWNSQPKKSDIKMKIGGLYPPSLQYTLVREKSQSVSCAWKCWSTTNLTWGGLQRTCTTGQNHAAGLSRNLPDIKYQSNPLQGHLCCECIIYSVSRSCIDILPYHMFKAPLIQICLGNLFGNLFWIPIHTDPMNLQAEVCADTACRI